MKFVKNDRDFRVAYELLDILSSKESAARVGGAEKLAAVIIDLKKSMRAYAHREIGYESRIVKDDGMDGYISLERLPDDIRDLEQAKEFFERFMTHHYRPSAYDCTGQAMTNWFKVFPRNGGFYAYHSVSFDF